MLALRYGCPRPFPPPHLFPAISAGSSIKGLQQHMQYAPRRFEREERGKGGVLFYLLLNYKLQAFFYDKGGDTFFPPRASYVVRILFPGHTKSSTSKFSCNTQSNIRFIEVPVSLCLFWQGSNKIIWHALKNLWVRPAPSLIYNSQVSVSRPDWNLYIRYVFSCPARLSLHFVSIHY